jgi:hypothetical protein
MKGPYKKLAETRLPRFRPFLGPPRLSSHQYSLIQDLTVQVYPLRADMAVLRRFVDSFLNFVDDVERPPFYFQPVFPYVFLQLLHCPRLAVPTENLISLRQHEVAFSIPLACYEVLDGKLVFKQFASSTPFIYLDQGVSIVSGRSLFGWPKVALKFDNVHPPDVPTEDSQVVNLLLRVPSKTGDDYVSFIEAFRTPRPYSSMRRMPVESIRSAPDAFSAYFGAAAEEWYSMLQFPTGGYERAHDIESMEKMTESMAELFSATLPMFPLYRMAPESYSSSADVLLGPSYMDTITLKEIRDAESLQYAAFQSVVRSTIYLDRFHDFGLLFNPMAADPRTDITILIHDEPNQQVVESLGLEVSDKRGPTDQQVAVLKPRFPYWVNLDLVYGLGTNLYWRGIDTPWSCGEHPKQGSRTATTRYCTLGGGALQESPLNVVSPKGVLYIATLPLAEDGPDKLRALIKQLLCNDRYDFCPYEPPEPQASAQPKLHESQKPPYLWLMVRTIHDTGVGAIPSKERELVLGTFVEWKTKGAQAPEGIGFLPLYAITDNESRFFTHSEVFGRPMMLGTFQSLGATWPWPSVAPKTELDVLAVNSSILPTLFSGSSPVDCELIRILAKVCEPAKTPVKGPSKNYGWITYLKSFFATGGASKAQKPSEPIEYPDSLVIVSLAQVVDCRFPANDIYQAIVMQVTTARASKKEDHVFHVSGGTFDTSGGVVSLPSPYYQLHIKFTRYDSVPIVGKLGLNTLPPEAGYNATIDVVQAQRHGWIDAAIEENGSVDFAWRLGASEWHYPQDPDDWRSKLKRLDPNINNNMESVRRFITNFNVQS